MTPTEYLDAHLGDRVRLRKEPDEEEEEEEEDEGDGQASGRSLGRLSSASQTEIPRADT